MNFYACMKLTFYTVRWIKLKQVGQVGTGQVMLKKKKNLNGINNKFKKSLNYENFCFRNHTVLYNSTSSNLLYLNQYCIEYT